MSSHNITITVLNNAVGIPTVQDGIMGMVMQGVSVGSTLAYDTPYLLTQLSDAAALGINPAYDVTNATAVYQQISEFYSQAGQGAFLWIQVCALNTTYATYINNPVFTNFITYSAQADVTMGVKVLGVCYAPPANTQAAADFPADVPAAVTALQTLQQSLFSVGYPFSGIVDGYNMSSTVTPGTIGTQATNTAFAVSLCITGTKGNGVSAVGLALGKLSRISVGRGIGAVADGALNTTTAFLTNGLNISSAGALTVGDVYTIQGGAITYNAVLYKPGQQFTAIMGHTTFTTTASGYVVFNSTPIGNIGGSIVGMNQTDITSLGNKQYFFITTVPGVTGLFWNDGGTCTASSNFFSSQEYNRVMNKLAFDARAFFTQYRGQNLPSDVQTGALDSTWCLTKQQSFYTNFIGPLSAASGSGDITDGSLTVTGPNYAATGELDFSIKLVRATILGNVVGTMQFALTL